VRYALRKKARVKRRQKHRKTQKETGRNGTRNVVEKRFFGFTMVVPKMGGAVSHPLKGSTRPQLKFPNRRTMNHSGSFVVSRSFSTEYEENGDGTCLFFKKQRKTALFHRCFFHSPSRNFKKQQKNRVLLGNYYSKTPVRRR
jgi:hypothetical protein